MAFASALSLSAAEPIPLPAEVASRPVLTSPDAVWQMTPAERSLAYPLRIECRVNYVDPGWGLLWMEMDGGVGQFMQLARPAPPLRAGQHVILEGTFTPTVGLSAATTRVTIVQENKPVTPLSTAGRIGEIRSFDRRLVTTEAYIDDQMLIDATHLRLLLIVEDRPVICWVAPDNPHAVPKFAGHFARITAVYSGRIDPTGTNSTVELWAARENQIQLTGSIARSPQFELPVTSIRDVGNYEPGTTVLIRGRLQERDMGATAVLRDNTGEVLVHTLQKERFPRDEEIEAVGRTTISGARWVLQSALLRRSPEKQWGAGGTSLDPDTVLRSVNQIRQLSPQDYARGRRVVVSGVVTWSLPERDFFFLQDVSGGIRVHIPQGSIEPPPLQKHLEVEGVTFDSGFAPAIELQAARDIGSLSHPQARKVTLGQVLAGAEDGQWVEMRGFIREIVSDGDWRWLHVTTPEGEFVGHLQSPENFVVTPGSLIRVRGVCETQVDDKGRLTGLMLRVPFLHDLTIEEDAPADLYDLPLRPLNALAQLRNLRDLTRVRVIAHVLDHDPGEHLVLQDGETALFAFTRQKQTLLHGDRIEAVGILGREGARTVLREAVYRRLGAGPAPAPVELTDPSRLTTALDQRLVRVSGRLIDSLELPNDTRFTLQSGSTMFEAVLRRPPGAPGHDLPERGSELAMTGIYQIDFDDSRRTRGFAVHLRSPDDIVTTRPPEMWTVRRALSAAAVLAACTLLGIAWVTALRRRVRRQTEQLRTQLEKEVVLQERHRSIIENASDGIFTTDLSGQLTSFNPAGERMTGFSAAEALTRNLRDLLVPEDDLRSPLQLEELVQSDGTVTLQSRLRTADGRLIWTETNARLLRENGQPAGILGIVRDISERKEIEEELKRARDAAEAATRAKSEFLANMSHEIRTPMNAVIGMGNLLLDTPLEPQQRDFAEAIRNGAEALLTVLNDILDFSKIEAGRLQFEHLEFDLRETIESTMELLGARAADKSLELSALVPSALPVLLRGDQGRLRQVLFNLIGNAIKFTSRGEVTLHISLSSESDREAELRFEVIDTGIGLAPEEQARLFRPFSQADSSTTRRFGGTGLGLAITKQIVELMHGSCGVHSTLGEGSTFWFTARFEKQTPSGRAPEEPLARCLTGRKVLVVEPAPGGRRVLEHYLHDWQVRTATSTGADEALAALRDAAAAQQPFDVVLIDGRLGSGAGRGFVRRVRAEAGLGALRILLLTTLNQPVALDARDDREGLACLVKPVQPRDLLTTLARLLDPAINAGIAAAGPAAGAGSHTRPPDLVPQLGGLRVLVAEDNVVNQRVALLQLKKLGCKSHAVANGLEVLAELERAPYDVILMDCQMPEMDGFAATARIREGSDQRSVYIIALTANAMSGDRERCLAAGMDDYLSKPMRETELAAALARSAAARPQVGSKI